MSSQMLSPLSCVGTCWRPTKLRTFRNASIVLAEDEASA